MTTITRTLRLNPWTVADVQNGKEPVHFDYQEPDPLDDFVNKAGSLFLRLGPDAFHAAGCPARITVTLTGADTIETRS
jgi:hypothetical protein